MFNHSFDYTRNTNPCEKLLPQSKLKSANITEQ